MSAMQTKGWESNMGIMKGRDALEDNYLALCTAILYPYGIGCEEAWRALRGKLEEPVVAAGILQDAAAILRSKKRKLERLRGVMNEEEYCKTIFMQELLMFYEKCSEGKTAKELKQIPCVRCSYAGSYLCWREFVKFIGIRPQGIKNCQFGKQ